MEKKHYREAIRIIRSNKVDSQAIIGYLQRNGFEDIALYFVSEPRARFNLAIRCGKLDIADECATALDEPAIWEQLAKEALRQGNHAIVEKCYQKTKSLEKLSFLYVVTGNTTNLQKMLKIAGIRQDPMSRFYNALYLGDAAARVQVLQDVGQLTLAYITAVSHGLTAEAEQLRAQLEEQHLAIPEVSPAATMLTPPEVVGSPDTMPVLEVARSMFDRVMEEDVREEPEMAAAQALDDEFHSIESSPRASAKGKSKGPVFPDDDDEEDANFGGEGQDGANGWGDDMDFSDEEGVGGEGAGWGDDLDLSDDGMPASQATVEEAEVPTPGMDLVSQWCNHSSLAYDRACAGNVDSACQLLHRQIGLKNAQALAGTLRACYLSTQSATAGFPGMPALNTPMLRSASPSLPLAVYRLQHVFQAAKAGMRFFQAGHFEDTLAAFKSMLEIVPLVVVDSQEEETDLRQIVEMAKEYILAVQIELARREVPAGSARHLLLAACMTQCKLQSSHVLLTLNSAMVAAFKAGNFIDAASYANRILVNPDIHAPRNAALEQRARKVLQRSEREGRNAVETGLSSDRPNVLDSDSLELVEQIADCVKCPLCTAPYAATKKGMTCRVCGLSQVGVETVGLVCIGSRK